MVFDNLKLRTKALVPLLGMALVFASVVGFGTVRLRALSERYDTISRHVDPAILRLARISRIANEVGRDAYCILVNDVRSEVSLAAVENLKTAKVRADQAFDEAARFDPGRADDLRVLRPQFDKIYADSQAPVAIGLATPGLNDANISPTDLASMGTAATQLAGLGGEINDFSSKIQALNSRLETANAAAAEQLRRDAAATVLLMIVLGAAAILGGLVLATWMTSATVAAPLVRLGERMTRLASGDLVVDVDGQARADEVGAMARAVQVFKDNALKARETEAEASRLNADMETQRRASEAERAARAEDLAQVVRALAGGLNQLAAGVLTYRLNDAFGEEYEQLRADFNAAMSKVQDAMSAVIGSAQGINAGAGQITQAADDLSRRTEQQAASLEETAAALDQITATLRQTAEGAEHARAVVGRAKADAETSGQVVEGAVSAMSAIERSSNQIGQIIGVIDEIAFQTNLLALNAGVEAARAGDAGKGFAVVASEVRALAQRSADAAKEIKTLIAASAQEVGQGVGLVGQAGEALQRIVEQVLEINSVVAHIAGSAQEQSTGLSQVNMAVNQMDQMTQQNAAMVEQSTAASHSLAQEAANLAKLTGSFEVGDPPATAAATRRAA